MKHATVCGDPTISWEHTIKTSNRKPEMGIGKPRDGSRKSTQDLETHTRIWKPEKESGNKNGEFKKHEETYIGKHAIESSV